MTSNEEKGENINKVCLWEALEYNVRWGLKQVSKFNGERVKCFNGIKVGRKIPFPVLTFKINVHIRQRV